MLISTILVFVDMNYFYRYFVVTLPLFYLHREHWMLAVIDPTLAIIYWLDPMGESVRESVKDLCEA